MHVVFCIQDFISYLLLSTQEANVHIIFIIYH